MAPLRPRRWRVAAGEHRRRLPSQPACQLL